MMAKQQLLEALEGGEHTAFLALLQAHESKRKTVDLEEVLLELSQAQVEQTWTRVHSWADWQLANFVAAKEQTEQPPGRGEQSETLSGRDNTKGPTGEYNEKLLEGAVKFACIYLNTFKDGIRFIPDKLLEMAMLLHEMLSVLENPVQAAVVALCELWWLQELEDRDLLVANVIPLLVEAATRKGAQRRDVLRLWALRDALNTIDLSSPDNKDFVKQLISCVSCPVFLKSDEGIKWLAGLFSIPLLLDPLHQEVRLALVQCTKLQSAKYGEVYFRAWKASQGSTKKALEEDCLQDLMYTAIHVDPMSGLPSANLHHLLHHIHRNKKHHSVATLITELYQPILWRSFKVANGYVRMNAAGLLCDAFPLSDSTLSQQEQGDLLERQYHTLNTLLLDPCHLVRITTIRGVSSILSNYWQMVPSEVIEAMFQKLLTVLVYDISSADVRTEVVKGLTLLLDSADAVPFLGEVLPRLGDVFDDASVVVRIAFAKLLLKVKASRAIRYWDIVPVQHLLHRLELDTPKVCRPLTQLLLVSFHPTTKSDQELLQRSLTLLEENRGAARRFYQYAGTMIDLPSTVHFMLLLWLCLRNYVTAKVRQQQHSEDEENESNEDTSGEPDRQAKGSGAQSQRSARRGEQDPAVAASDKENSGGANEDDDEDGGEEEEEDEGEDSNPLDNPDVMGGILDTVVILWTTNAHKLAQPQNFKYLEALRTKISKSMPLFFKFFKGNYDFSRTLLYLSSFLPRTLVPTLVGHCMSQLRTLQGDKVINGSEECYKTFINSLCNWNCAKEVLELASEWLEEGFKSGLGINNKERRQSRRRVRFCETSSPQPRVALRFLCHVLQHPLNKASVMQRDRRMLLEVTHNMAKVKDSISERLNKSEELSSLCCDEFLCECWAQYLSQVVVCHSHPSEGQPQEGQGGSQPEDLYLNSPACVSDCLDWSLRVLVPCLEERGGKRKLRGGDEATAMAATLLKQLLTSSTHLLMVGAATIPFVYKLNSYGETLLKNDTCGMFWEESLFLAKEAYEFLWVYEEEVEDEEASEKVTPTELASVCVSSVSEYFKHQDNLPKGGEELSSSLMVFLVSVSQRSRQDLARVMDHLVATVLGHLCWLLEKNEGVDREVRSVQELGAGVALLVGACQKKVKLSVAVMEAFSKHITKVVNDITTLLAASHLLKVLLEDSGKIARYSLKQTVMAASSVLAAVTLPEEGREGDQNSSMTVNEEHSKITKEILDELKTTLGII